MTTVGSMLALPSFRESLNDVLARAAEMESVLRSSLTSETPVSAGARGLDDEDWKRAVAAYRLVWEIAHREGRDEVLADIEEGFPSLSPETSVALRNLLADSPDAASRIRGIRKRDRFLPILTSAEMSLDLRFIEFSETKTVAPVVTARFEFDESVGTGEAISFQVPLGQLDALVKQAKQLQVQLAGLGESLSSVTLVSWALEGVQRDGE